MLFGSKPADGGHLLLSDSELAALTREAPHAVRYVKGYVGAAELLKGERRHVLWLDDSDLADARRVDVISDHLDRVRVFRAGSSKAATRKLAAVPHRFAEARHRETPAVVVPAFTSERRDYIPVGYLNGGTVASNKLYVVYGAEPWVFGLVQSRMHMSWVRAVGGRLKTDYGYSATLCYNTFPVPPLTDKSRELLTERAFAVLEAREHHSEKTLAQLYDPEKMPEELREAHQFLDAAVDQLYRKRPFQSDDERLELLFDMYEATVSGQAVAAEPELELAADA